MAVKIVKKTIPMRKDEIIKFQLLTHCFVNDIVLSDLDLDCLTALGLMGESELTEFCNKMANLRLQHKLESWEPSPDKPNAKKPIASPQTIRNVLIKVEKYNLLVKKKGRGRKKIELNPDLQIQTQGDTLLDYKCYYAEPKKVAEPV